MPGAISHPFNIGNWYWAVATDATHVWSSASRTSVVLADATYGAWLAAGYLATPIATFSALYDVLARSYPAAAATLAAAHVADLSGNQNYGAKLAAGLPITSAGSAGIDGTYQIEPAATAGYGTILAQIANGGGLPGGGSTFLLPDINGVFKTFTLQNFTDFVSAVQTYIQNLSSSVGPNSGWPTTPVALAH
jgi:hypothetical protein